MESPTPHSLFLTGAPSLCLASTRFTLKSLLRRRQEYDVGRARMRLQETGVEPALIDRFLVSFFNGDSLDVGWRVDLPGTDRFDAFLNLLHAAGLVKRGADLLESFTEAERRGELDAVAEKVYSERFRGCSRPS